jgi:hypothetical protein
MANEANAGFSSKLENMQVVVKTGQEIHDEQANAYGLMLRLNLKCTKTPLEGEHRSGHLLDSINEEMCNKVEDLVYYNR